MLLSNWKSLAPTVAVFTLGLFLVFAGQVIEMPAQIKELEDLRSTSPGVITLPDWAQNTTYSTDQVVLRSGITYRRTTPGTSGALFDSNDWIILATGRATIGDIISSATVGSVLFAGDSAKFSQDNSDLFWDSANNRLGIGTTTPGVSLEVNGEVIVGSAGVKIISGTGTPEGTVAAPIGSTYHREDGGAGTSFYVKESGGVTVSGWVGK